MEVHRRPGGGQQPPGDGGQQDSGGQSGNPRQHPPYGGSGPRKKGLVNSISHLATYQMYLIVGLNYVLDQMLLPFQLVSYMRETQIFFFKPIQQTVTSSALMGVGDLSERIGNAVPIRASSMVSSQIEFPDDRDVSEVLSETPVAHSPRIPSPIFTSRGRPFMAVTPKTSPSSSVSPTITSHTATSTEIPTSPQYQKHMAKLQSSGEEQLEGPKKNKFTCKSRTRTR